MIRQAIRFLLAHKKWTLIGFLILVVTGATVFVTGVTVWEYNNSTPFCGTTCHTMPPEYVAYQRSPHARVSCVDCHLGQESVLQAIPRKAKETRHVLYALTQEYEVPIYVKNLRPARDTCEKCHNPDKFSNDTIKVIKHYLNDENNTEMRTVLSLKTGGGSKREGLGKGIHWHIENEVWFIATDELKQNIPYVRQVDDNGQVTEFFDLEADLPPDFVAQNQDKLHRMDCIDCHNRISHLFRHPDDLVDDAVAKGRLNRSIPFIRAWAASILKDEFESHEEAAAKAESLDEWYARNFPDYYAENKDKIRQAIDTIKELYTLSVFPEMEVGWITHPNNLGHKEFPGCFRCHDGKHLSKDGEAIRLECNLCHTIPRMAGPGLPAPIITLEASNEPESHKDSNWIARHRQEFDETCAGCHSTFNRGGADNSSFCANGACHGIEWKYAGLDAPKLRDYLPAPRIEEAAEPVAGDTGDESFVPRIPHPLSEERIGQCLACHGPEGLKPYTPFHEEEQFPLNACTECHQLAPTLLTGSPP
ncbi:MAG: hypothetical protein D6775_11705 [Caldilineae bacterium]|nr:MAG: hypothetical protein D6775_11705 [Caldilineae bacterium]